jgi:suppressor of G2 allele of SKP1
LEDVPEDEAWCAIEDRSLHVVLMLADGSGFSWAADPLFATVMPDQSSYRVLPNKVEVILAKEDLDTEWTALENAAKNK